MAGQMVRRVAYTALGFVMLGGGVAAAAVAAQRLTAAGLTVGSVSGDPSVAARLPTVRSQRPAAGSMVAPGSAVNLTLA